MVCRTESLTSAGPWAPVTVGVTATSGADFLPAVGVASIPAGSTTASITVPVVEDTLLERDETFRVILSEVSNALLADASAVGLVLDDD